MIRTATYFLMALVATGCGRPGGAGGEVAPTPKPAEPKRPAEPPPAPPAVVVPTPDGLTPVGLPGWVGFPADPAALNAAITARTPKPLREHAWRLWAGINQPISAEDARPLWWTWSTTTQLFEEQPPAPVGVTPMTRHRHAARLRTAPVIAPSSPEPRQPRPGVGAPGDCFDANGDRVITLPGPTYVLAAELVAQAGLDPRCSDPRFVADPANSCSLGDGPHFQNNGDILVATESYNAEGARRIEEKRYNEASTLQQLLDDGTRDLPDLAREQVNTKHMYWPVKASGLSAVPVFHDSPAPPPCQYNGYETWKTLVAVDPGGTVKGKGQVEFLFGVWNHEGTEELPTRRGSVAVHPLSDFYSRRIDKPAWDALDPRDRRILDAASRWAHGRPFEPGDYVVAVASHIISKEIPQWTLQTAWWSERPDEGPYAADRPALPEAVGPWAHYLMAIEYGIPTEPNGDTLPVAFNPFIELAATHPVATNCRNCHLRARWPASLTEGYITASGPGPLANLSPDDPMFAGSLRTDFQWVIADRVKASAP